MTDQPFRDWGKIAVLSVFEYPQHAGLTANGSLCLVAEYDSVEYLVWDIHARKVIWRADSPNLEDWIQAPYVEIEDGPAQGKYRIFGLHYHYPLLQNPVLGIRLELDGPDTLILKSIGIGAVLQTLNYEPTTDWEFASFSDDGNMIAVLTTHDVTFFTPLPDPTNHLLKT